MATRYNENFKIEVVKAYMAGDRSISEIAADYNVAKSVNGRTQVPFYTCRLVP